MINLPNGTRFRVKTRGRQIDGKISDGQFITQNGDTYKTPSGLVNGVSPGRQHVNGWEYVEVQKAGQSDWTPLSTANARESRRRSRHPVTAEEMAALQVAEAEFEAGCNLTKLAAKHALPYHRLIKHLVRRGLHTPRRYPLQDNNEKDTPVMSDASEPVLPALNREQKRAILAALDDAFDAESGVYRNGDSDQEIARRLNVPWAAVAEIREDFLGPLRADPDVATLRVELESLRQRVKEFTPADLNGWLAEYDRKVAEIDEQRKEMSEYRKMVATEKDRVVEQVASMARGIEALSEKLGRIERRFRS